ncbi:Excalibur calcium-binding domain-containing protein [Candidatus Electrothrix marina]|uniref:Excalibur calcium-binding domain-containing protein n=1 Tax=Candidatus Electrothrix marina TaxID=1859130 RepID=A0A3S3QI53_9BACT|nr:Excalibur calcium-binding domain-containing protein [Candidatus Electrothrix marina]RWX51728.1 Excalibur calcium-binding domain-containing protein [Candidatus Electrothrix marina]
MRIQITEKKAGCLLVVLILVSLLHASVSEATEFYLSVAGGNEEKHCDSLQIRENNIACIEQNQVVSYDLSTVEGVQIIDKEKIEFINRFTPGTIKKINASNQRNRDYEETVEQIERSRVGYLIRKLKSVESFADLQKLGEKQYQKYGLNGVLHLFLPLLGVLLVFVGLFWLIIAAFRVHIFWGLGCLLLPFVSLFFLFLHWRSAAKPFMLSVIGVILACSGVYLFDEKRVRLVKEHREQSAARSVKKKAIGQKKSEFSCQGKTRCTQMRSCAEATFYIRNCPGTKMDGDGDGIPCESQWCH